MTDPIRIDLYTSDAQVKCDFAWSQLLKLASVEVYNPNSGTVERYISQSYLYTGPGYGPDPFLTTKSRKARLDILLLELAYSRLKDALGDPRAPENPEAWVRAGMKDDREPIKAKDDVPHRKGGLLAAPEIFDLIRTHPDYPYARIDDESRHEYADVLAEWLSGKIIFEPCGGAPDNMIGLLKETKKYKEEHPTSTDLESPKIVIGNDTEQFNLDRYTRELRETFSIPVIGVRGDWMDVNTYVNNSLKTKRWTYLNKDILAAMRDDPAGTVVYLPGAMANDFEQSEFLTFLHDNFKPGTLFLILYDNTTDIQTLSNIYAKHALVRQLALTGLTHACWNLNSGSYFDPRVIGVEVEPIVWGDDVNIQISVFTKNNPERKLHITPIVKMSDTAHTKLIKSAGFESVGRMRIMSKRMRELICSGADASLLAFTHAGYAYPYREPLERHNAQALAKAQFLQRSPS